MLQLDKPEALKEAERVVRRLRRDGRFQGVDFIAVCYSDLRRVKDFARKEYGPQALKSDGSVSVKGMRIRGRRGVDQGSIAIVSDQS